MAHNPKVVGSNPTLAIKWGEKNESENKLVLGAPGVLGVFRISL